MISKYLIIFLFFALVGCSSTSDSRKNSENGNKEKTQKLGNSSSYSHDNYHTHDNHFHSHAHNHSSNYYRHSSNQSNGFKPLRLHNEIREFKSLNLRHHKNKVNLLKGL